MHYGIHREECCICKCLGPLKAALCAQCLSLSSCIKEMPAVLNMRTHCMALLAAPSLIQVCFSLMGNLWWNGSCKAQHSRQYIERAKHPMEQTISWKHRIQLLDASLAGRQHYENLGCITVYSWFISEFILQIHLLRSKFRQAPSRLLIANSYQQKSVAIGTPQA